VQSRLPADLLEVLKAFESRYPGHTSRSQ
jgi:hypothetical protein